MFALVESAFRVVDLGNMANILERRRSLPGRHDGLPNRLKKEIRESFPILDTDSDGLVSRDQVEDLVYRVDPDMTHEEMQDLLDTADLDADGMYDMDEYLFLMYLKWNDQESVDDIKEAFRVFDKDSNGTLSRDEFAFILRKLGEPLTDHEVDEILNHFDRDGSGEIDFDEFAYVMTGPHLDDKHGDTTGIPFAHRRSFETMSPAAQKVLSPSSASASRSSSCKAKNRAKSADQHSKKQTEELQPMAGMYGRRIVNSAPAGRERIKFTTTNPGPETSRLSKGSKPKHITSAAELRVLGSSRPLTSRKVVGNAFVTPAPKPSPGSSLNADAVIERYHGLYEKPAAKDKQKQKMAAKRVSDPSLDSDNFSMCSDVIRHMNATGDHDRDLEEHYV